MKDIKQYTCPRCNFQTKNKKDMRRHLYEKKTICSATKNNIELTDEIKEDILLNRIYKILKEEKQQKEKTNIIKLPNNNYIHYIYLIRCKENVRHNENIYKVGKTIAKELTINLKRLTGYGIGTELILIRQCKNCDTIENTILEEFNKKFTKYELGREYFIGDYNDMIEIIHTIISKEYIEYKEFIKLKELEVNSIKIIDDTIKVDSSID
jgi:hypothetical protein